MSATQYGIPTPIQFDRLYAGPLDKHEVFDSYTEALTYAQGTISYPGQTIGVKKSGLKEDVYVINQDKSLSRLMIQREDIRLVLKKDGWTGDVPFEQVLEVPYLEPIDNCIISLGDAVNDPEIVRQIVQSKIADTIQEDGRIRFIARGSIPTVDIPITITIGSIVSAVEIPNNVNDNTNHTVVIAKQDAWQGTKPPYTQELYVFGVRPDSNGTIGINPDSSYAQINKRAAAAAGVIKYEQKNNYITIAAMNSKPSRDLEILVVWGDEIVVFENSDTLEDFNTSLELVLKANDWSQNIPYTQTVRVEGLSEYHTGVIGISENCTPEQAQASISANLELIEQGEGYVVVEAKDTKPLIDIPIYLTYGSNITVVPSPEYVGEANRHVDSMAYASKWIKSVDGWEQEVDVEGITSNSIGTMGLRSKATDLQSYAAAVARIKISKVYDNKVLLTATKTRPVINIPLSFVFGRNINVAKYPGAVGKVMGLNSNYIIFDDTKIQSGLTTIQELLEYFQFTKSSYGDTIDRVHDEAIPAEYMPEEEWSKEFAMSSRMGRYLYLRKMNYDDAVDKVHNSSLHVDYVPEAEWSDRLPLSSRMGRYLYLRKMNYDDAVNIVHDEPIPVEYAPEAKWSDRLPLSSKMGRYLYKRKVNYDDMVDKVHDGALHVDYVPEVDWYSDLPLSSRMGRYLYLRKINYDDIVNTLDSTDAKKPLSANAGRLLNNSKVNYTDIIDKLDSNEITKPLSANAGRLLNANKVNYTDITDNLYTTDAKKPLSANMGKSLNDSINGVKTDIGNIVIKVQSTQPAAVAGKNVIWIKI